jgi:quercetin dioxygenase-like cupin family protein
MPGGVRTEIHLTGEDTDGAFCMLLDEPPDGWSLPPHRHRNQAETMHILDGTFELETGGRTLRVTAGDTALVPLGVVHSTRNVGSGPGRRVVIFSPAGMEHFFIEAGAPDPEAQIAGPAALSSAIRHGWEFV